MKDFARQLKKAMDKSETVRKYLKNYWNVLYNDLTIYGLGFVLDEIAFEAMIDMEKHDIKVFSIV